jgi:hypothetical protein
VYPDTDSRNGLPTSYRLYHGVHGGVDLLSIVLNLVREYTIIQLCFETMLKIFALTALAASFAVTTAQDGPAPAPTGYGPAPAPGPENWALDELSNRTFEDWAPSPGPEDWAPSPGPEDWAPSPGPEDWTTICPAANPLLPTVVTPNTFACAGACCAERDSQTGIVSAICVEEQQLADAQGADICAAIDALSEAACGGEGGVWALNEGMSNKECSALESELQALLTVYASMMSTGEDGQPLDPAPDVSALLNMVADTYRAEVGEVCCDGYSAADLTCTAEDLQNLVSPPPPPLLLPPAPALYLRLLRPPPAVCITRARGGGPAGEHERSAGRRSGRDHGFNVGRVHAMLDGSWGSRHGDVLSGW